MIKKTKRDVNGAGLEATVELKTKNGVKRTQAQANNAAVSPTTFFTKTYIAPAEIRDKKERKIVNDRGSPRLMAKGIASIQV